MSVKYVYVYVESIWDRFGDITTFTIIKLSKIGFSVCFNKSFLSLNRFFKIVCQKFPLTLGYHLHLVLCGIWAITSNKFSEKRFENPLKNAFFLKRHLVINFFKHKRSILTQNQTAALFCLTNLPARWRFQ